MHTRGRRVWGIWRAGDNSANAEGVGVKGVFEFVHAHVQFACACTYTHGQVAVYMPAYAHPCGVAGRLANVDLLWRAKSKSIAFQKKLTVVCHAALLGACHPDT